MTVFSATNKERPNVRYPAERRMSAIRLSAALNSCGVENFEDLPTEL
jgi:hypothetical protein